MGGASSKFDGEGGLESVHGGSIGGLKIVSKISVKEFI